MELIFISYSVGLAIGHHYHGCKILTLGISQRKPVFFGKLIYILTKRWSEIGTHGWTA